LILILLFSRSGDQNQVLLGLGGKEAIQGQPSGAFIVIIPGTETSIVCLVLLMN